MNLLRLIQRVGAGLFGVAMLAVALLVAYHGLDTMFHASAGDCVSLGSDLRVCLIAD